MSFDGKERRELDRDWVERDRLLTEVHEATKSIKETLKSQGTAFTDYVKDDKKEHSDIKKRVFFLTIAVVVIGVILGGPSFAMMLLK